MLILIADDSQTSLAMLAVALNKLGHEVMTAANGEQAVALFKQKRPSLIILDVMMKPMNGFECAKVIREINPDDWIPIIFLSGQVDDESIVKGIDAGGDDYLTKPFSEITLAAKIKAMQRIADMRDKLFEATQKLYLLSSTDALTGIYNRVQFDRSIKEITAAADRFKHSIALLFIDLDNFKNVNDSFGHQIGDMFLVEVANRLKTCIRSVDFVARLSGDEFAVILSQIHSVEEAGNTAQKIINALSRDYMIENHYIRNGASIGIAFYPGSANTIDNLVLNADIAMYHAKASGRNNFQYFTDELNEKYKRQISLEHSLKFALEKKELFLTYQPIFDLKTKALKGIEVLLGWDHPRFGLVSPSIFVPLAEESGLITKIGEWVIQTACMQSMHWPLDEFPDFRFAINISSRQLFQEEFFQQILDSLGASHMPANRLELELTETSVMSYNDDNFRETIQRLHDIGISISIDDFGTGYSSLIRLKHLPIRTLKIEKFFVQDAILNPNGAIIVSCLIALGNNLGMNVIAEGIETKEQLEFLLSKGCPQGQGYLLSKPLSAEQVEPFLKKLLLKHPVT